ncbi:MAG: DUF2059 domain-containing protein [Desulfobulbaceae bacterium]|nr:DUF2059 domain-containing protein [Desulfobulbaceae bacterium]
MISKPTVTTITFSMLFCFSFTAHAVHSTDTPESRMVAATNYLQVASMRKLLDDTIEELAQQVYPEQRAEFKKFMRKGIRIDLLEKAALESMVKTFTTKELQALVDFYGSQTGKSIMNKMGMYTAEVMPSIQQEVERVLQEVTQEDETQ